MDTRGEWVAWTNVALGVWLMVSPIALGYDTLPGPTAWNTFLSGILVTAVTLRSVHRPTRYGWGTTLGLGVWLIASGAATGFPPATWNHLAAGFVIGGIAFLTLRRAQSAS